MQKEKTALDFLGRKWYRNNLHQYPLEWQQPTKNERFYPPSLATLYPHFYANARGCHFGQDDYGLGVKLYNGS